MESSGGRMLSLSKILLLTSPGQTTETPIPWGRRLQRSASDRPRTANLEAV